MNKPVRVPNEIYPIRIAASQAPVVVTVAGKVIATTFKALMLFGINAYETELAS